MFDKKKYQGEVWLPGKEENKCFCILTYESDVVFLETNLFKNNSDNKLDEVYGLFNGLGILTFINCRIQSHNSGLLISRVYYPEYSFISEKHFINGRSLKFKEFSIVNSAIVNWYSHTTYLYNSEIKGPERVADDLEKEIFIKELGLKIEIRTYSRWKSTIEGFEVNNQGYVKFISDKSVTFFEAKALYDRFQKFLHFFHGNSSQFQRFSFLCEGCEEWKQLYYENDLKGKKFSNILSFNYRELSDDLDNILQQWYTNEDLIYCIDMILENQLSVKISHSRRFVNSIFALEAFYKRFSDNSQKYLNRILLVYKDLLMDILKKTDIEVQEYIKNIVAVRKDFVHGNIKKRSYFSDFELLYISILIDHILAVEIFKYLKISKENIEKVKMRAEAAYHHQQQRNFLLNQNILLK